MIGPAVSWLVAVQTLTGGPGLSDAIARFQAGDCNAVIAILSKDAAPKPGDGEVPYALLASCQLQVGRVTEGVRTVRDGLAARPQSGVLMRILGQQLFREDPRNAEAGALLEGAMAALPADPESRHYFAQWAHMNNRDRDCVRREREALQVPGLSPVALLQMNTLIGLCEGRSGDPDAAHAAFEVAWTINKSLARLDTNSAYQYVRFLADQDKTDQLRTVLAEALARVPREGPILLERAKLLGRQGMTEAAIEAARLALAGDGHDAASLREAHIILARSYFIVGQLEKAEEEQRWVDAHQAAPMR